MTLHDAKQYIATKYPNKKVVWVDKGQMNHVAIVDHDYVYKFPKKPEYISLLKKEFALYKLLQHRVTLAIPVCIDLDEEQYYMQVSYVSGATLSEPIASSMSPKQQKDLSHKLSVFMKELNKSDIKEAFDIIALSDTNDFYYVENWLKKIAEHCSQSPGKMSAAYLEMYGAFREVLPYGFCKGDFLAHKDLHEDNMLFDDRNSLIGVIDFAEMRYTSVYSELRTVVRFGVEVVEQIINELGVLAKGANAQDVKLFATIYEMAIVYQHECIKKELSWRVEQAKYYLRLWGIVVD